MKPLIKWPGGKSNEFKHIKNIIPTYDRYIEPFFGGGAVFFNMPPRKTALINDLSSNLMKFYDYVKTQNKQFKNVLYQYNHYWTDVINAYFNSVYPEIFNSYQRYRGQASKQELVVEVENVLMASEDYFIKLFAGEFIKDTLALFDEISRSTVAKINRMVDLEIALKTNLSDEDIRDNVETGVRSGVYYYFRNVYNDMLLKTETAAPFSSEEEIANFYFVREYCYGSMFRYNSEGRFNIPYGGIAYNKKDFKKKLDNLFCSSTVGYFANTAIYNCDFEDFFNRIEPTENDFIFLDPPYDSDFSDYEGVAFNAHDQIRLANYLKKTNAQFILIIKTTDFIYDLYDNQDSIRMLGFEKQYTYNVRSRNDRKTTHLIITNCRENQLNILNTLK